MDSQITTLQEAFGNRERKVQDAKGEFAVLVPLVEVGGELHLLFEMRSANLRGQPGEPCFPGGRMEQGESSAEAAVRETVEELGLSADSIQVLAELDLLQDIAGRVIYPILAYIKEGAMAAMAPNRAEVELVFTIPLRHLQEYPPAIYRAAILMDLGEDFPYEQIGFPNGYSWNTGWQDVPIYAYKGHSVWGITGRIIRWFLKTLEEVAPCASRLNIWASSA